MAVLFVSWTPVAGAVAYRIRWQSKDGNPLLSGTQTVTDRSSAPLSFSRVVMLDVPAGSGVYIAVSAIDAQGREGESSQEILYTVMAPGVPLPAPINVTVRE